MKKTYIQPTMKVAEMGTQQDLLTASVEQLNINSDSNYAVEENAQLSRRQNNIWDDDDE
jgi:hypothetical protein